MSDPKLTTYILAQIDLIKQDNPIMVAINGIDGVGKTHLAQKLSSNLVKKKKNTIHLSIDNFANFRNKNNGNPHVNKETAAQWHYEDAFDFLTFKNSVIDPIKNIRNGKAYIKTKVFSWHADESVSSPPSLVTNDTIIIVDGVFLFHPSLVNSWDFKIFLSADFEHVLLRALDRDSSTLEDRRQKEREYRNCYYAAQKMYFETVRPEEISDIVINYNDYQRPILKLEN